MTTTIPAHRRAEEPPRHAVSEELREGKLTTIADAPPGPVPAAEPTPEPTRESRRVPRPVPEQPAGG